MVRKTTWMALAAVAATISCREPTRVPPRSLDSPTAMAVARGDVCLTTFQDDLRVVQYSIDPCADDAEGAIGLITNEQSDRLALLDLSVPIPRLVDLDPSTPGPNHLEVGRLPVDVAASPDGAAAYTLNQLDRDVSVVDLSVPEVLTRRYHVDGTPIELEVDPGSGEVVVAAGSPSRLYGFEGATSCEASDGFDCDVAVAEDVEPRILDLPGTVSDFVFDPRGDNAWVIYRDLDYASVVSFAPTPDGFQSPCLNGADDKPCVTAHVSLEWGCYDGLDNDGDGLVDQQDVQCFGPKGAESPEGIGRVSTDVCSNGEDDDGDGLVDREDPECQLASGVSEEVPTFEETPIAACVNGVDDDSDGAVDFPNDAACYGALGRTEESVRPLGFDSIGIGPHAKFVYVVDRAGEQVLVVDAARQRLIDAPKSQLPPSDRLDQELGVEVTPSPLSVTGVIDRRVEWADPDDVTHAVIRYDYGAWVSSNNGSLQYVDGLVGYCEVRGEELATREQFWRREQGDVESRCLDLPEFPLASAAERAVSGDPELPATCQSDEFVACAECLVADEEECPCEAFAQSQFDLCQRAFVREDATLHINPRFALRDGGGDQARILGDGTCEQPEALVEALQAYANNNPTAPQDLKCRSLLMPQPLAVDAAELPVSDVEGLDDIERATTLQLRTLQFDLENANEPLVGFRPFDARILNETVSVTYEGVLPGTARSDGVLDSNAAGDGSIWLDVGFDPCTRGVRVGDHVVFTGEQAGSCGLGRGAPEYEVVERNSTAVRLAPIDEPQGESNFANEVPTTPGCFEVGAAYEVRAAGQWTVVGDALGYFSESESAFGECVPRYEGEQIRSRVSSGELYQGPYYSFFMYPGFDDEAIADEPIGEFRDTSFAFQISSGFQSVLFPVCSSLGSRCDAGFFPTQVVWVPGLDIGTLLMTPDPNDDFIHVRNLDETGAGYTVVR